MSCLKFYHLPLIYNVSNYNGDMYSQQERAMYNIDITSAFLQVPSITVLSMKLESRLHHRQRQGESP